MFVQAPLHALARRVVEEGGIGGGHGDGLEMDLRVERDWEYRVRWRMQIPADLARKKEKSNRQVSRRSWRKMTGLAGRGKRADVRGRLRDSATMCA